MRTCPVLRFCQVTTPTQQLQCLGKSVFDRPLMKVVSYVFSVPVAVIVDMVQRKETNVFFSAA